MRKKIYFTVFLITALTIALLAFVGIPEPSSPSVFSGDDYDKEHIHTFFKIVQQDSLLVTVFDNEEQAVNTFDGKPVIKKLSKGIKHWQNQYTYEPPNHLTPKNRFAFSVSTSNPNNQNVDTNDFDLLTFENSKIIVIALPINSTNSIFLPSYPSIQAPFSLLPESFYDVSCVYYTFEVENSVIKYLDSLVK